MDLIYADANKNDIGVLKDYSFDLAYGSDENNFVLTVSTANNVCQEDYFIYIEGTEYGGIIDSVEVDTANKKIKYKGRTWHGILDKKIIEPESGQDYYTVNADLNAIITTLITRLSLTNLFKVSTETTKTASYQFQRYVSGYKGITKLLDDNGYKLSIEFSGGFIELSAQPITIYDEDSGLDSDRMSFKIQKTYNPINHLICLGSGTLKNRTVVHLYLDDNGNVSTIQTFTGIDEVTEVYDYPNAESTADLTVKGKERLLSQDTNSVNLKLREGYSFDIGDKVTVTDIVTGITVTRKIIKKIVTINKDVLRVDYSVGE